jgi:glutamine synthetase
LDALEADHEFLLAGGVFSEGFIHNWIREISQDAQQIVQRPHPYEYMLYFNC